MQWLGRHIRKNDSEIYYNIRILFVYQRKSSKMLSRE